MLSSAQAMFVREPQVNHENVVVLMEMTMKNLTTASGIDHKDFLDRVDVLGTLGKTVLISNYGEYHRLAAYLFRYTKEMIGLVMGLPSLRDVFQEKYYTDLEGGILESFGRLFKNNLKLYVYPQLDPATGAIVTAGNLQVQPNLRHLHSHLMENKFIESIHDYDATALPIYSVEVLARMVSGDPTWESMVPPEVARIIKDRKLLGYTGA